MVPPLLQPFLPSPHGRGRVTGAPGESPDRQAGQEARKVEGRVQGIETAVGQRVLQPFHPRARAAPSPAQAKAVRRGMRSPSVALKPAARYGPNPIQGRNTRA